MDQTYRGIVTPRDRDRDVFGIEIDRVPEEHDLNRRDDHYQRDARSIVNEMQQFEARDSQHAPEVSSQEANIQRQGFSSRAIRP
jgi:hypothetical protein